MKQVKANMRFTVVQSLAHTSVSLPGMLKHRSNIAFFSVFTSTIKSERKYLASLRWHQQDQESCGLQAGVALVASPHSINSPGSKLSWGFSVWSLQVFPRLSRNVHDAFSCFYSPTSKTSEMSLDPSLFNDLYVWSKIWKIADSAKPAITHRSRETLVTHTTHRRKDTLFSGENALLHYILAK